MSIRLPFQTVPLSPGAALYRYWGAFGYRRPTCEVYLVGPAGRVECVQHTHLDTGSDYPVFEASTARALGLSPPFSRRVQVLTAGGTTALTMPDDGIVSLFITDYRECYYLPLSPIGFWSGSGGRNVLGFTGFLQYFEMRTHNDGVNRPETELTANQNFPGQHGSMVGQALRPLLRRLWISP
jgi:hypothetical protein